MSGPSIQNHGSGPGPAAALEDLSTTHRAVAPRAPQITQMQGGVAAYAAIFFAAALATAIVGVHCLSIHDAHGAAAEFTLCGMATLVGGFITLKRSEDLQAVINYVGHQFRQTFGSFGSREVRSLS